MQIRTKLDSARLPKGLIISQTKKNEILIEKGLDKIRSENIKSNRTKTGKGLLASVGK